MAILQRMVITQLEGQTPKLYFSLRYVASLLLRILQGTIWSSYHAKKLYEQINQWPDLLAKAGWPSVQCATPHPPICTFQGRSTAQWTIWNFVVLCCSLFLRLPRLHQYVKEVVNACCICLFTSHFRSDFKLRCSCLNFVCSAAVTRLQLCVTGICSLLSDLICVEVGNRAINLPLSFSKLTLQVKLLIF